MVSYKAWDKNKLLVANIQIKKKKTVDNYFSIVFLFSYFSLLMTPKLVAGGLFLPEVPHW